jgi:N utilization substance protein B
VDEDLRSEARERAMGLLYEAQAKGSSAADVLAALPVDPDPLAVLLVEGVEAQREEVDALLGEHARGWTIERMPVLDRTVMEIATFELLSRPEVPTAVVLDEAVELAKRYGTDDSGRFVNGVLSAVARKVRPV